jgi:hypothetical protein
MKKQLRNAGFVSLTLGALGCGEPSIPAPADPQELFKKDAVSADSLKGEDWRKFLDAKELHRAWVPAAESPWRPYYKPTLIAAIATVQSAAKPLRPAELTPVETEAVQFGNAFNLKDAAVFVDLPGGHSVVWGAVLRQRDQLPVVAINNWPHPFGLLSLERPLGGLLYYAAEVSQRPLPVDARPAFILEHSRLGQKGLNPSSGQFDNRYFHVRTDFPSAAEFRRRGINQIVYVNPRGYYAGCEEDDLNEYFTELARAGLQFIYVRPSLGTYQMAVVTPGPRETIFTAKDMADYASSPSYQPHYYHSYSHYSYWHTSYWSRSSGAWGGSDGGSGSGFSS